MKKYPEYNGLNLPAIADEVLKFWEENDIFAKSVSSRDGKEPFVFYEGPPSANGIQCRWSRDHVAEKFRFGNTQ